MIIVSSFRPLDQSAEYAENQQRALKSWLKIFSQIIYFNQPDDRMNAANVFFIDGHSSERPTIKRMMQVASGNAGWSCICNADIVIGSKIKYVEQFLDREHGKCAMSRRFEFDPGNITAPAVANDLGIDIFCAAQYVWQRAAADVPAVFELGRQLWDTWLLSYFMTHWPKDCYDFGPSGVIFHPKHEGRKDQSMEKPTDGYVDSIQWPFKTIMV